MEYSFKFRWYRYRVPGFVNMLPVFALSAMLFEDGGDGRRPIIVNCCSEGKPPSFAVRPGFFDEGVIESIAWFFLFISVP